MRDARHLLGSRAVGAKSAPRGCGHLHPTRIALVPMTVQREPETWAADEEPAALLEPGRREIWMRRALFCAFAAGFTVPYFKVLNRVDVRGP